MSILDNLDLASSMSQEQRILFEQELLANHKSSGVAILLALFLGGLGAHRFYLREYGWGVLYAIFFWTWIPALIALVEAFFLPGRVRTLNRNVALEAAKKLQSINNN